MESIYINHFNLCISIPSDFGTPRGLIFVLVKYGFQLSGVPKWKFKKSEIGTALIGFWVNAVGFSTALFLDVDQLCIL